MSEELGHGHGGEVALQMAFASIENSAVIDPQFRQDAIAAAEAVGVENLNTIAALSTRFDIPTHVEEPDGSVRTVPHFKTQLLFRAIPDYAKRAAAAGLTEDQAADLVKALLSAEERSQRSSADQPVTYLGEALALQGQKGPLTPQDYEQVRRLIAKTASREDDNASALDAYRALSRLGMETEESIEFIRSDLRTDSELMNPALKVFNALSIAEIDTGALRNVCQMLINNQENSHDILTIQSDLKLLRECFVTVGPGLDVHPNELLTAIQERLSQGTPMIEIAQEFMHAKEIPEASGVEIHQPDQRREGHFLEKSGPLESSPLPYRTERSFVEGIKDLGSIALHKFRYRQPVDEGLWVYDSDTSIWYSLGGETELNDDRVSHNYPVYPLHELSQRPSLVHCHPKEFESYILGDLHDLYSKIPHQILGQFLAATPSRRDYRMVADILNKPAAPEAVQSFIVHGNGLTEYTFPQDPEALQEMARKSQEIRGQIIQAIDWRKILYRRRLLGLAKGKLRPQEDVVRELVDRLNDKMSPDFGLRLNKISDVA